MRAGLARDREFASYAAEAHGMSGKYRGFLKVAGSSLRGWLVDTTKPARRVRFNLIIDDELRGTFTADRKRQTLFRRNLSDEDTYGFTIPIRKPWISGKPQLIRLEDPGEAALDFSLRAKLGPSAHTHFAENVVGGQASLGERAAQASARDLDDEHEPTIRAGEASRALLKQIAQLGDGELVHLLSSVERDVVLARMARHDKAGDWQSVQAFRRLLMGGPSEQTLLQFGRSAMAAHNLALAARVSVAAAVLHPQSLDANLLAGSVKSLQGEFDEAMRYLRLAERMEKDGVRAKREMVVALGKQLRGELSVARREEIRAEHLALLGELGTSGDALIQAKYRVPYATALFAAGRYGETIAAADAVLALVPNDTRALMIKARALVATNAIAEAHLLYEQVLDIEPAHRGARTNLRILAALAEDEADQHAGPRHTFVHVRRLPPASEGHSFDTPLAKRLAQVPQRWICTTAPDLDDEAALAQLASLEPHRERRMGCLDVLLPDGRRFEFWHRGALIGLAESGLIDALDDEALKRWKPYYGARRRAEGGARGVAALMSRHGASMYGGGEHFLEQAAEHHARQGFEPVIVGASGREGQGGGRVNGWRSLFLGDTPAELRRFFLENDVALVHAISGLGFAVAEALAFTNIPFVYGVHFWNEMLGGGEHTRHFDDVTGQPLFRREFQLILARATAVYANSEYTQRLIEEGFGVRCPVVFATPR
jgi:tetratricopeptide (TPR) repeat protein